MVSSASEYQDAAPKRYINVNRENKERRRICCTYCPIQANFQMYKNNTISTGKYNVLTFLPRNLQEQFSKMVNFYYLVMMIMELFKPISDSGG
jgi:hypothetical protein